MMTAEVFRDLVYGTICSSPCSSRINGDCTQCGAAALLWKEIEAANHLRRAVHSSLRHRCGWFNRREEDCIVNREEKGYCVNRVDCTPRLCPEMRVLFPQIDTETDDDADDQ